MRLIIALIISVCFLSCKEKGNKHYTERNPKKNHFHNKKSDTAIYYFENAPEKIKLIEIEMGDSIKQISFDRFENIKDEGVKFKDKKIGNWKFYNDGRLETIEEYLIINGKEYVNQAWYLDEDQDTLYDNSHFFNLYHRDVFSVNDTLKVIALLNVQWFKNDEGYVEVKIASDESTTDFNEDFSNEKDVDIKTFHNLTIDTDNKKWVDLSGGYEYAVVFGKKLTHSGDQAVRGYIIEKTNDSINQKHRKFYFRIPIKVED